MSILEWRHRIMFRDGEKRLPISPTLTFYAKSEIHGIGVFTLHTIPAGVCLGDFTGDLMDWNEFKQTYGNDRRYCCVPKYKSNPVIVAKHNRNWITYLNESSEPNCKISRGKCYTTRDIKKFEELTLYYGKSYPRDYKL